MERSANNLDNLKAVLAEELMLCEEVVSFAFSDYGTYRAFDFNASIYEFMSCYNARLTILYITDNYRKAIKYICKPLKDKLQNGNLDDYQKTKDCRDFVDMFIVLRQYLDATTKSMRIKCVAITPTRTVPIHPGISPVFLKAAGIASKPDPNDDLSRWKNAPKVL
ncbi:hypothetical protein HF086_014980 [Spodoptera exigua]|uniref:Uncharacterized protein n=1 Tax=Spodoptera exigua TaxID=7107 RepID=A0A922SIA3_SPOEX|nr:hypothetical protein HF086_014980 [Spodoptera exigua]